MFPIPFATFNGSYRTCENFVADVRWMAQTGIEFRCGADAADLAIVTTRAGSDNAA
jgi:hypothetical protein